MIEPFQSFCFICQQYEPLLLLPIAFGMLLVNLYPSIMAPQSTELLTEAQCAARDIATSGHATQVIDGVTYYENPTYGGLLWYLYQVIQARHLPTAYFHNRLYDNFGAHFKSKEPYPRSCGTDRYFCNIYRRYFPRLYSGRGGAIGIIGGADGAGYFS